MRVTSIGGRDGATRTRTAQVRNPRATVRTAAPARGAARPKTLHARPASKPQLRTTAARRRRARRALPLASQKRRLNAARSIMVVLLLILVARLVQLQGFESTKYAEEGQKKRLHATTLIAHRGSILDRNGAALAVTQDARIITVDQKIVRQAATRKNVSSRRTPAETAAKLAPLLRMPAADVEAKLVGDDVYVEIATDVDVPVAREIMALELPGISYKRSTKRVYPNDALAASLVGFVNKSGKGGGGVESAFQDRLAGTDGTMMVEQAKRGVISSGVRRVVEPKPGADVQLTIDRDIQWTAERTLAGEVQRTGAAGGHIIVMDVKTGEILALASAPTFNPNAIGSADPAALGSVTALSNVYEPGSVLKVVTAAAAVETGLLGPESTVVVPPSITVADKTFEEHGARGEQLLTLTGVMAKSSNVGTIGIAQRLGKETIHEYLQKFGLGDKTGVGVPGESKGLLPPVARWSGSQVGNIPIGQGVSTTALQMAQVYAIVANGGLAVTPSLFKTRPADPGEATAPTRVIKESSAAALRQMLEAVTGEGGTAPNARIDGYRVAGKTGTARRVRDGGRGYEPNMYVSSFIGFAPADKPELLVEVVLDRPRIGSYYAGTVSTPAFKEVMSFALTSRRVPPTTAPVLPARLVVERKVPATP